MPLRIATINLSNLSTEDQALVLSVSSQQQLYKKIDFETAYIKKLERDGFLDIWPEGWNDELYC